MLPVHFPEWAVFACVKNTVSPHGWRCEFNGNVNNSVIDRAARLFHMDYASAFKAAARLKCESARHPGDAL